MPISSKELLKIVILTGVLRLCQYCVIAFGMETNLVGFLTVLGASVDDDRLSWPIEGSSRKLGNDLGGLVGTPQGIIG